MIVFLIYVGMRRLHIVFLLLHNFVILQVLDTNIDEDE